MLHELMRDDVPNFDRLMSLRVTHLSATDRTLTGLDSPSSPEETVGSYCFMTNMPNQIVAARLVRHVRI